MAMTVEQIVHRFVDAINQHDVDVLVDMMTADHTFVDSDGHRLQGADRLRDTWAAYFAMFPDYTIQLENLLTDGATTLLAGTAEGTYARDDQLHPLDHWIVPAAWKAVTVGDKVALWQVFVNPQPIVTAMNREPSDDESAA
jgi:hypothetical protein